jgi:hypothetical protein
LTELADPDQLAAVVGHLHDDRLGGRRQPLETAP